MTTFPASVRFLHLKDLHSAYATNIIWELLDEYAPGLTELSFNFWADYYPLSLSHYSSVTSKIRRLGINIKIPKSVSDLNITCYCRQLEEDLLSGFGPQDDPPELSLNTWRHLDRLEYVVNLCLKGLNTADRLRFAGLRLPKLQKITSLNPKFTLLPADHVTAAAAICLPGGVVSLILGEVYDEDWMGDPFPRENVEAELAFWTSNTSVSVPRT
jgi:hypothetical protein